MGNFRPVLIYYDRLLGLCSAHLIRLLDVLTIILITKVKIALFVKEIDSVKLRIAFCVNI